MRIYQPRSSIMDRFDSVMILAKGRTIYYGSKDGYTTYMEKTLQCSIPRHESPYDVLLDELNPAIGAGEHSNVGDIL